MKTFASHAAAIMLAGFVVLTPIPASAIPASEEAVLSRDYTLMFGGLREKDPALITSRRVEAIIFGLSIYYYHFEDDPELAATYRGALAQALLQHEIEPEVAAEPFLKDLAEKMNGDQARGYLELSGFDKATASRIVADARADKLSRFFAWLREDPKYKKKHNKSR